MIMEYEVMPANAGLTAVDTSSSVWVGYHVDLTGPQPPHSPPSFHIHGHVAPNAYSLDKAAATGDTDIIAKLISKHRDNGWEGIRCNGKGMKSADNIRETLVEVQTGNPHKVTVNTAKNSGHFATPTFYSIILVVASAGR